MNSDHTFKTIDEIKNLSSSELKELYVTLNKDSLDEWFPINYVSEICPICNGEAMLFENFKQMYLKIVCVNNVCEKYNTTVDQFEKGDDFLIQAIALQLGVDE